MNLSSSRKFPLKFPNVHLDHMPPFYSPLAPTKYLANEPVRRLMPNANVIDPNSPLIDLSSAVHSF